MANQTPRLVVPELATAMRHPTRSYMLTILTERVASPKEIAKDLNRTIRHVTYHLGVLEELGCVELVVGSPLAANVSVSGFTPCNTTAECPSGQVCNVALQRCE